MITKSRNEALAVAADVSYGLLDGLGGNLLCLEKPYKNFILVHTAQAMIDNSGIRYLLEADFFTSDFHKPIVDAYIEIGCDAEASFLEKAILSYENNGAIDEHNIDCFLCGNENVWLRLYEFVIKNCGRFLT